jgi:hypothetical protein
VTAPASATSAVVTGLTSGTSYTFTISAANQIGPSDPSQASKPLVAGPDHTAPTVTLTSPISGFTLSSTTLRWTGSDAGSGVASYDVRYRRAAWNGTWSSYRALVTATTSTARATTLAAGFTYCFSARARDRAGNVSGWTSPRCVARPIDDRALTATKGWSRRTGSGYYGGTYSVATRKGAALTRSGGRAVQVAVVVTKCANCGSVAVYAGSTRLGVIKLAAAKTARRTVVVLPRFSLRTFTLTLRVTSSGKPVQVDAVAFRLA